ncbi:MAG: hypothetical protein A3E01_10665, partial [Gammaproteobacteria bacterium RIFCSPHIGHO2_12_FULL_63_22]
MEYDFKTFTFGSGAHRRREDGMCVMEAVAYIAGEPHTDHPECACPVISAFMRRWNDAIRDDDLRRALVGQFVFRLPGTKATTEIEDRRRWMAVDWCTREAAPEFLTLTPKLQVHAAVLRELPPINAENWQASRKVLSVVLRAARRVRDERWGKYPEAAAEAAEAAVEVVAEAAAEVV